MKIDLIILGGMGPQASLKLHDHLIRMSRPFHQGTPETYPGILHVSLPVPDFINSKRRYKDALNILVEACNSLPLDEATAIGIACNTAHLMVDSLPLEGLPFVSMIKAVVAKANSMQAKKVGILASPNTLRSGLYDLAFKDAGIEVVKPNSCEEQVLDRVIHSVIDGAALPALRKDLEIIACRLMCQGADTILLGCTELPLIGLDKSIKSIDSLEALSEAMLDRHFNRSKAHAYAD